MKLEVEILQIRDSSYQIGYQTGESIRNKAIVNTFGLITKSKIDIDNMKNIYNTFAPYLIEELEGIAASLHIPFSKAACLFSGYDVPKTEAMGCSAVMTKDYYVRNYDFGPELYDGIFSMVQPENTFASAGYNLQAIGRHDGVNEYGLTIGLHFVSNIDYSVGLSPWISIRMILDTCKTTDDAIQLLKEIPHSACYNFSIGDNHGNIAVVEATPSNVFVRQDDELLSCVNHFQIDELKRKNRQFSEESSLKRNKYLQKFKDNKPSYHEMFNHFSDEQSPLFFNHYKELFGTLHTFAYSYEEQTILTSVARSNKAMEINFKKWLNGQNIKDKILYGIIEY